MKTFSAKPSDIQKKWYLVDATGQTLGRLASQIAYVLRGKHKAIFTPHMDTGDYVVVVNADKVVLTGQKELNKAYYRHSGYFGGLKTTMAQDLRARHPERLLELAIKGMLPHNKLGRHVYRNLKVYAGTEHPHAGQNPQPLPERLVRAPKA
jgi:large subunit ribosomal protein L13